MFKINFKVQREIIINKPISEVYAFVSDFNNWKNWSPWLCMEPSAKTEITNAAGEIGHKQSWVGHIIGSGDMTIASTILNKKLEINLIFYKPWKSESASTFDFETVGNETKVKWSMSSGLPFFMFFMKKMMVAFIGSDFNRGLSMLKEYLETGVVLSKTEVTQDETKNDFHILGIKNSCEIKNLSPTITKDFQKLHEYIQSGLLPAPDFMLDFTHVYDMVTGKCEYTAALAYKNKVTSPEKLNLIAEHITQHKALTVMHTGTYKNLGNAWSTAMSVQRNRKLKKTKVVDMYEIYLNNPMNTEPKDLKTQIVIPYQS